MNNFKVISIITLIVAVFLCSVLVIPSFVGDDYDETSAYSPISVNPPPENVSEPEEVTKPSELDSYTFTVDAIMDNISNLDVFFAPSFDRDTIEKINKLCGKEAVEALADSLENGNVDSDAFKTATGYSAKAFYAVALSDPERTTVLEDTDDGVADFIFVGDTAFPNGYSVMNRYNSRGKGIEGCVLPTLLWLTTNLP